MGEEDLILLVIEFPEDQSLNRSDEAAERKPVEREIKAAKLHMPRMSVQDEALQENASNGGKEQGFEEDSGGANQNIAQVAPANPGYEGFVINRPGL